MMKKIGFVLMSIGLLSALTGALWHILFPAPDANIGAGGLVVLGLPFAVLGLLVAIAAVLIQHGDPGATSGRVTAR